MATVNAIITVAARRKMARARAGSAALPKVVGMAFGNGGVNSLGQVVPPQAIQSSLTSELHRKPIDKFSFPEETTCRYECTLSADELTGAEISEIGLYDSEGDLVCIKTFMKKGKEQDIEQTYVVDDIF